MLIKEWIKCGILAQQSMTQLLKYFYLKMHRQTNRTRKNNIPDNPNQKEKYGIY